MEAKEIEKTSKELVLSGKMLIRSQTDAAAAVNLLKRVVAFKKKLHEMLDPQCDAAYKSWQISVATRKKYLSVVEEVEKNIKKRKSDFDVAEENRLNAERIKALEKAKAIEDRQRAKLEKKLNSTDDEETRAVLQEQIGSVHVAVAIEEEVKHDGVAKQPDFDVTIFDKMALLKAVATGKCKLSVDAFEIKKSIVKAYMKSTGDMKLAGCKVDKKFIQRVV